MPKTINKVCQACALGSISKARQRDCWNEDKCKSKRNNYRRREQTLPKRREAYAKKVNKPVANELVLTPEGHWCELILYGNSPSKQGIVSGAVKGIKFNIYKGQDLICYTTPLPCYGMNSRQLETVISGGLAEIRDRYEINYLGRQIWIKKLPKELS